MAEERTFTYVRIPAGEGEPTEELGLTTTTFGDALPEHLTAHFSGGSIKNADGLRAEYGAAVDQKMAQLNLVASRGSVEVFALVRPSKTTMPIPHAGTYFYFDEMGVLKDLPVNKRAAQIAASCGLDVESPFLGDVFIGRVVVEPSPMRNGSVSLAELDSSSIWLRSAPSENAQYQMAMAEYEKAAKQKTAEGKERALGAEASEGGGGLAAADAAGPPPPGSHKWSQTTEDLEVTVALPPGTTKRDVSVAVGAKSIKVIVKGTALVDLALFGAVRPDEMTWTINAAGGGKDSPQIAVMVEKADVVTWHRLEAATYGQIL